MADAGVATVHPPMAAASSAAGPSAGPMLGMDDSDSPVDEPPPPVDLPGSVVVDPGTIVLADPVGAPDMLDEPGVELGQPVLAGDEETASEDEPIVIDRINVRRKKLSRNMVGLKLLDILSIHAHCTVRNVPNRGPCKWVVPYLGFMHLVCI